MQLSAAIKSAETYTTVLSAWPTVMRVGWRRKKLLAMSADTSKKTISIVCPHCMGVNEKKITVYPASAYTNPEEARMTVQLWCKNCDRSCAARVSITEPLEVEFIEASGVRGYQPSPNLTVKVKRKTGRN